MKDKVIFIVGPTASGKTSLGIKIAKEIGGEIISADSMQIYKEIHIASAAPCKEEMCGIEHHLLEFLDLTDQFSVADYVKLAREKISEIISRNKIPIIVGGTGLYISSLLDNTLFSENKTDFLLREKLENEFDEIGGEKMLDKLRKFDISSANRLHINDRRRIIRAFEVYIKTGKTITEHNENSHLDETPFESLVIGVSFKDRQKLYNRINKRVDIMIENGLVEEAKNTYSKKEKKGAFQAIGHKELYGFFDGENTLDEAVESLKQQTRRYAKRQLTWFRRNEQINWFYSDENENIFDSVNILVSNFLKGDKS